MASVISRRTPPADQQPDVEVHTSNDAAGAGEEIMACFDRMIHPEVLNRTIGRGFVELGPEYMPAVSRIGFQLTAEGWVYAKSETPGRRCHQWAS